MQTTPSSACCARTSACHACGTASAVCRSYPDDANCHLRVVRLYRLLGLSCFSRFNESGDRRE